MASVGMCLLLSVLKENRQKDFLSLKKDLFYAPEDKLYFFIHEFYTKHQRFPSEETVNKKFGISFDEVKEPFSYWLGEVSNRFVYTTLTEMILRASPILTDNPHKAFEFIKNSLFKYEQTQVKYEQDITTFADLASNIIAELKDVRKYLGLTGIPTGWETLDKITQGYQNGDVYVYVARVKSGKSLCLLYSADKTHQAGYTPLIISMEMKVKQFAKRHLAIRSGIGYNFIKSGLVSDFAETLLHRELATIQKQHPFYYIEGQLKKNIYELSDMIQLYRPHIVFIDGGYLIDIDMQKRSRWEELEVLMKVVKSTAMRLNIPIIITFQFNKEMLKKKQADIDLSDIRLSDDIGAIASVGIGIFDRAPHEVNITEDVIANKKYLDIIGGVGREGEHGGFYINWDWDRMDFSEISSSNDELILNESGSSYDFTDLFG